MTGTQPSSCDQFGLSYVIATTPNTIDTFNSRDKFIPMCFTYDQPAFARIYTTALPNISDRLRYNLYIGGFRTMATITNNSTQECMIRMYSVTFKDDVPTSELADLNPGTWNEWVFNGFNQTNFDAYNTSSYRNINLKFAGNLNQWCRIRMVKKRYLRCGQRINYVKGSKKYRLQKYDRVDSPGQLFFRRYSRMMFIQVTPTVSHPNTVVDFSTITNLRANQFKLDVEWKTFHYYKLIQNFNPVVSQSITAPQTWLGTENAFTITNDYTRQVVPTAL